MKSQGKHRVKKMQCNIEIVEADTSNFEAIKALYFSSDEYHYQQMRSEFKSPQVLEKQRTRQGFEALIANKDYMVYLAIIDNIVCGLIAGKVVDQQSFILASKRIGYIDEVSVLAPYRGRGVAKMLVDKIEAYFEAKSVEAVSLNVYSFNTEAAELYRRLGYREKVLTMSRELNS